jgi:hypothetical protein
LKPLPSLFRGIHPSPKPGAALAAAATTSRVVLTPHTAAIKSRRSVSAPVEKILEVGAFSSGYENMRTDNGPDAAASVENGKFAGTGELQ